MFIQGGMFILVVTALPEGVLGWIQGDGPRIFFKDLVLKEKLKPIQAWKLIIRRKINE